MYRLPAEDEEDEETRSAHAKWKRSKTLRNTDHLSIRQLSDGVVRREISQSDTIRHGVVSLEPRVPLLLLSSEVSDLRKGFPFGVGDGCQSSFQVGESGSG